jgi:hypothetical protein
MATCWPIHLRNQQKTYKAETAKLEFSGTTYESSQVQPGTFAILRPWEEVKTWGKEAILSYDFNNGFRCIAWMPNEKTPGTFLKSSWSWDISGKWNWLTTSESTFNPNTGEIVVTPKVMTKDEMAGCMLISLMISFIVLGILFGKMFFGALKIVMHPRLTKWPILG